MSESNIKWCPFCGSYPVIQPWHGGSPTKHALICEDADCAASPMVTGETLESAIDAWNARAPIEQESAQ